MLLGLVTSSHRPEDLHGNLEIGPIPKPFLAAADTLPALGCGVGRSRMGQDRPVGLEPGRVKGGYLCERRHGAALSSSTACVT